MKFAVFLLVLFGVLILCVNSAPQKRIINGHDVEEHPRHVAFIRGFTARHQKYGGGTFVTTRHIVTSAVLLEDVHTFFIGTGSIESEGLTFTGGFVYVIHPQYNKETFEYAIGLIDMEHDSLFAHHVTPIALPSLATTPHMNEQGKVSSFGISTSTSAVITIDEKMQSGYYRRIPDQECNDKLNISLPSTGFCAKDLDYESSLFSGDLGAGMTLFIDDVNTLVGVVTVFTNKCNKDFPAIFTKVAPLVGWINEQIGV